MSALLGLVVAGLCIVPPCQPRPWVRCYPSPVVPDPYAVRYPCYEDKCLCSPLVADCSSNAGSLAFIPHLPDSIRILNFSNNGLTRIGGERFFANVSTDVWLVDLYNNGLDSIAPSSFQRLEKLTRLLIGGNRLSYSALTPAFNVTTLETLDIRCGGLGPIPPGLFDRYPMPDLTYLDLSFNEIRLLDMHVFQPFKRLSHFKIWDSKLTYMKTDYMPSLSLLGLHKNSLTDFPVTCDDTASMSLFPNLIMLHADFNDISSIEDPICLPKLQFLNLQYNRFEHLRTDTFINRRFPALSQLWLNQMEGKWVSIAQLAFNNSALTYLSLGYNKLDFSAIVDDRAFEGCPNIQELFLENNTFEFVSDQKLQRVLSPMPELNRLHLGNTKKSRLTRRTFSTLKKLERLYLFGNYITFLPDGAFDDLPLLKMLRLENNRISTVSSDVFSPQTRAR